MNFCTVKVYELVTKHLCSMEFALKKFLYTTMLRKSFLFEICDSFYLHANYPLVPSNSQNVYLGACGTPKGL